jgi:hypothetical protein
MRLKWIALTFLLGFVVILDPTLTPGQQPGGDNRGGKGKGKGGGGGGGFGGNPGGFGGNPGAYGAGFGGNPGGFGGNPGGFGGNPGAYGAGGFGGNPGGFGGGPGGFGRGTGMGPAGGAPGGGNPGGGGGFMNRINSPETTWALFQTQTGSTGDTIDLSQLNAQSRGWMRAITDRAGAAPLPESGTLSKSDFFAIMAKNDEARAQQRLAAMSGMAPGGMPMGPDGFGPRPNFEGWDNPANQDRASRDRRNDKKDKDKDADDDKPVAIRYGKLPKGLPDWFEEYDIDKDGQVALWEWRKSGGGTIAEFKAYDLNDDGVITADELLRGEQLKAEKVKIDAIENGDKPPPTKGKGGPKPANTDGDSSGKPTGDKPAGDRPPGDRPMGKGPRDGNNAPGNGDKPDRGNNDRPKGKDGGGKDGGSKDSGDPRSTDKSSYRKVPG